MPFNASNGGGTLSFANYNGGVVTQYSNVTYVRGPAGDIYSFGGSYNAGTVPPPPGVTAYDRAINNFSLSAGGSASVTSQLTYQTQQPAAIFAPSSSVDPGASMIVSAEYYRSDLVPPVSYQWYQDGAPISGATDTVLTVVGGSPNSSSTYDFYVTDSQNTTVSTSLTVFTTAGCGTQLIC